MKTSTRKLLIANIIFGLLGIVSAFQACGPGELVRRGEQNLASSGELWVEGPDGNMIKVNLTKSSKVTDSGNVLEHLASVHGLDRPTSNMRNALNNHRSKLSETGAADSVNPPSWLAITNLSAESCRSLINKEKATGATRNFFTGWTFDSGPVTDKNKTDAIRALARAVWGRNETAEEKTAILSTINNEFTAAQADAMAFFMCTAMTASLDTHDH